MSRQLPDELPIFGEPDLAPYVVRVSIPRRLPGPRSAIAVVGASFFFFFRQRLERGDLSDGIIAVVALALVLAAIVLVNRHASTPEARDHDPP
jgi:hypothetical protein